MVKKAVFCLLLLLNTALYGYWDEDTGGLETDGFNEKKLEDALSDQDSYLEYTAMVFIRLYQKNISGKSGAECVFYPSCSRFSFYAVNSLGFFEGIILTAGRLQRCHLFAAQAGYEIDYERNLFVDKVEENIIFPHDFRGRGEK
jgi:hypothetical protein